MKTLKQACTPASIFDTARRDTVLDLAEDRMDANEFFAENYITEGMRLLLTEGFRRLEGRSEGVQAGPGDGRRQDAQPDHLWAS